MKNKAPMVRLGDYIEECDKRNTNLALTLDDVKGISTGKEFIETKADMNGVSLEGYKIVASREFAYVSDTSRRGDKVALAFNSGSNSILISSIYSVFRSKNETELLPEYLFLLFNRIEFDRYARFNSWGSARETLDFSELCRTKIPLPSIDTQRELVAIYDGLKKIVAENEALIKPLEEACRSFLIDLKRQYSPKKLGEYIEESYRTNSDNALTVNDVKGISTAKTFIETKANMDGVPLSGYKVISKREFVYVSDTSRRGDKMALAFNSGNNSVLVSSIYTAFRSKDEEQLLPEYLYLFLCRPEFDRYSRFNSWGSARETFDFSEMCRVEIPVPPIEIQRSIAAVSHCLETAKRIIQENRERMKNLCPALVQKAVHSV